MPPYIDPETRYKGEVFKPWADAVKVKPGSNLTWDEDEELAIQVDIKSAVSLAAGEREEGEEEEEEDFAGDLRPGVPQLFQLQVVPQKTGKQGRPTRQPVPVTKQLLKETKNAVKNRVTIKAEQVVEQLEDRFPPTKVQQGLVIIDPRYWLPGNYSQDSFKAAIKTVSDLYGVPKRVGDPSRMVPAVLDAKELVRQTRFVWEFATGQQGSISRCTSSTWRSRQKRKGEWIPPCLGSQLCSGAG